jgi:SAM-dependent methyltransferase
MTSPSGMQNAPSKYDRIGVDYAKHRRADPRLVNAIVGLLDLPPGSAIADVGAGSGNYGRALADRGFAVKAVEPSKVMRDQASAHAGVEWFPGVAESLPLADHSVDGIVCVLAWHHLQSPASAVREMARASPGPFVILTYDPRTSEPFWLSEYFPEIFEDGHLLFPPIAEVEALFHEAGRKTSVVTCLIPHDVGDLFLAAGWRRPDLYLDPEVRGSMSVFASESPSYVEPRVNRLRTDLETGAWHQKHRAILGRMAFDAGYRFIRVAPEGVPLRAVRRMRHGPRKLPLR